MSSLILPLFLAAVGMIAAFITYRNIRRGGAKYYTLEREAMLRRAMLTLLATVIFFGAAVGLLAFEQQQTIAAEVAASETAVFVTPESAETPELLTSPPTPTSTPDLPPTEEPSPTPLICRAVIEGTGGNGLTLRDGPGGEQVVIVPEGSIVTILDDVPQEVNQIAWRNVRHVGGDEGWVAADFLRVGEQCE